MKLTGNKTAKTASQFLNFLTFVGVAMVGYFNIHDARAFERTAQAAHRFETEVVYQTSHDDHSLEYQEYLVQLECLARNIYFEARGETELGQRAVAWVTLNRVQADRYPDTVCGVVHQARRDSAGNPIRHQCQFSWYCDGQSDRIRDQEKWQEVMTVAQSVMLRYTFATDPTQGATMYHADYVDPYWSDHYTLTVQIDTHIFYADDDA